jgi:hypothetical protein
MIDPMAHGDPDEFGEIDVTEEEFDEMFAAGVPALLDPVPHYYQQRVAAEGYYTLTKARQAVLAATTSSGTDSWALTKQDVEGPAVPSRA